jgi:hypothetical protein
MSLLICCGNEQVGPGCVEVVCGCDGPSLIGGSAATVGVAVALVS